MVEHDRYETYDIVPAGYNLRDAPPDRLDFYGIPQRPDAVTQPELFAFWEKLVSGKFVASRPTFSSSLPTTMTVMRTLSHERVREVPASRSTHESSLNWSGALVTPTAPRRVVFVVGGWTVPQVSAPSMPALFTQPGEARSLAWIGIDGHNGRLPKVSLPQIGTGHTPGEAPFAWWDWWSGPSNSPVKRIDNFQIATHDEILAGLVVLASQDVLFFIKNETSGEFRSFLAKPPGGIELLGSSAEWVMERPTHPTSRKQHQMADYEAVNFKYCMAVEAELSNAPGRLLSLANNGRMIKMREAYANPYRTVYASRAKRRHDPDGSIGVTCTYQKP